MDARPVEAQASGLPVVAVAEGGPTSLIEHGETGLLAPADAEALADGLLRLAGEELLRGHARDRAQGRVGPGCSFPGVTNVQCAEGAALARAALAGNPSDGYGGAVLAVTLTAWCARAQAAPAAEPDVAPANALVEATVRRFARCLEPAGLETAVSWSTSIPQRVGLGSSSALVIAVLRALCELHGVALEPDQLAAFALAVETEDLGIVAGLQDRVAQAYEGLTFMDFDGSENGSDARGIYEQLDTALLPPLLIAWRGDAAAHSGDIHASLRARHRDGEPLVDRAMAELAAAARGARDALMASDLDRFAHCVDQTFDLRHRILNLDPRCVEMIEVARGCGASANYTGSGGAIVALCPEARHLDAVAGALAEIGCEVKPA